MKSLYRIDIQRPQSPGNKRCIIPLIENFSEECHCSYLAQTWDHCDNQFSHYFPTESLAQNTLEMSQHQLWLVQDAFVF